MTTDDLRIHGERVRAAEAELAAQRGHLTAAILKAVDAGLSYRTIAKHVGLSSQRIGQILKENQQ